MTDPIAAKIAADMLDAARKLERFAAMYDALYPAKMPWTAEQLRHEAAVIKREGIE